MRYLLCFIPPLALLSCGRVALFPLNLILTLLFYVPGVIHAFFVVGQFNADKRTDRLINALNRPGSSVPALPQTSSQGRSMKPLLFAGVLICFFVFALAAMIVGFQNKSPKQNEKLTSVEQSKPDKPASVEQSKPVAVPAADKLPAYTIISDESNRAKKWRTVKVRLQEKVSEEDLKRISEDVQSSNPKKSTKIQYLLPEQIVGAGAWAIAEFDPALKIEVVGNPKGAVPPKPDGEIVGQWEHSSSIGMVYTLSRTKDGLKMICTGGKDNTPISDELVTAKVDGNRVTIRPTKAYELGDSYWILDEEKNLLLVDETGTFGKAAAIIRPTLKP